MTDTTRCKALPRSPLARALRLEPHLATRVEALDVELAVWRQRDRMYVVPALADPIISIHVAGAGRVRYGDGDTWSRRSSTVGTVTYLPVGVHTRWVVEGGEVEHLSITIGPHSRLRALITDAEDCLEVGLPDALNVGLAQGMIEVLGDRGDDGADDALLDSLCETTLRAFARRRRLRYRSSATPRSTCDVTAVAIRTMEARCAEPLHIAELAAAAGLSAAHFSTLFKRATGLSPHQYLVRLRLERVCAALRDAEVSLVDIAHNHGFSSQSHLNTTFRRLLGVTPAQYREQLRH